MYGDWTFELIFCVDRSVDLIGKLDCSHGQQKIKLVVNDNCSDPNVDLVAHPECDPNAAFENLKPADPVSGPVAGPDGKSPPPPDASNPVGADVPEFVDFASSDLGKKLFL